MIEILNDKLTTVIPMNKLKPLQVARIVDSTGEGTIVMRTASGLNIEVMNLSSPGGGKCWDEHVVLMVELLTEPLIIKITNEA